MEQFLNSSEWNSGVKQVRGHMVHMYARKLNSPSEQPRKDSLSYSVTAWVVSCKLLLENSPNTSVFSHISMQPLTYSLQPHIDTTPF